MKVLYTAPNRGHHYRYALAMAKDELLYKFVSGFSRFSPRSALPEISDQLVRADFVQNIYLAGLKLGINSNISSRLAYLAKKEQDAVCRQYLKSADIFLFYSGSGLNTCKAAREYGKITIVEAVNSHIIYQEELLRTEFEALQIDWKPFYKTEVERRLEEYELADYILLPSEFVKKSFLDFGFSEKKLIKVPYGFNKLENPMASTLDSSEHAEKFTVLYVGSISVRKGIKYLIEAFKEFNHPNKRLLLVGPKADPDCLKNVIIPDNVVFTGVLKGKELEIIYKEATVFCLPSVEEGLALVLGEALSFGIPIIATENTGVTDLIEDGKEGFWVPIRDSSAIAEKLQLLSDDKDLYQIMKGNALGKSRNLNGWDATGKLLNKSLLDVFNSR